MPPGILNLRIVEIRLQENHKPAILFALGAALVEFFQCLVSIVLLTTIYKHTYQSPLLKFIAIIIFLSFALRYFNKSTKNTNTLTTKLNKHHHIFFNAIKLSLLNVLAYPYWSGFGILLYKQGLLDHTTYQLIVFSLGAAFGSFSCLLLYSKLSKYAKTLFFKKSKYLNICIALIFLAIALYHIISL